MVKTILVFVLLVFIPGLTLAGGIVPHATGEVDNTKDTLELMAVKVADYDRMKFIFRLTQVDTLRTDTLHLSLQKSFYPTTGYATFYSFTDTNNTDTATFSLELNRDSVFTCDLYNYVRFYLTLGDSSGRVNSEVIRPDGDEGTNDWSPSTGSDFYALVDEASMDSTDYNYVTGADSIDALTFGDHVKIEITVDSVRHTVVGRHASVTSEVIRPTADEINDDWSTTGGDLFGEIDEASIDTTDYIYVADSDSHAVLSLGDQSSAGTAAIDSVELVFNARYTTAACTLQVGVCVTNGAGCDTCDCTLDTTILTSDTASYTLVLSTSPRGTSAWTSDEVDSATVWFKSLGIGSSGAIRIFQAYINAYYTSSASIKYGVCITDTSACDWSDSVALSTSVDTFSTVFSVSPQTGNVFSIFETDSLVGIVKSQHILNGAMRIFQEFITIYYNAGDMSPPIEFEVIGVLRD